MKTGMLRLAGVDVLARMRVDAEYWPEPYISPHIQRHTPSNVASATAGLAVSAGASYAASFPVDRPLTQTDRILLCGNLNDVRLGAIAAHAVANAVDVWWLEKPHADVAIALIEALGITLCRWGSLANDGDGASKDERKGERICSVAESGEVREPNHIGWLVASGRGSERSLVGFEDVQGWVHVLGDKGNVLQLGEHLLTPFEGVQRLETHPRVIRACLLAVQPERPDGLDYPGLDVGFFAVAEIAGEGSPVLEVELLDYCRAGLSAVKCPQGVMFVGSLPRTRSGAPDYSKLWAEVLVAHQLQVER